MWVQSSSTYNSSHFHHSEALYFGVSGTGVRQSQAMLEKPGGATRQLCGLRMSVSWIVHDSVVRTQLSYYLFG